MCGILQARLCQAHKGQVRGSLCRGAPVPALWQAHPKLTETYKRLQAADMGFEMVFCSADKEQAKVDENLAGAQWLRRSSALRGPTAGHIAQIAASPDRVLSTVPLFRNRWPTSLCVCVACSRGVRPL